MKKLTEAQRKEIYELYLDPSVKIKDIAATYGVDISTVGAVAVKMGAPLRQPKSKYSRKTTKKCPTCKKNIDIKDAAFCPYCGTDIRDAKELLIHRIIAMMPKIKFMPAESRDELQKLLIDIQAELKKGN